VRLPKTETAPDYQGLEQRGEALRSGSFDCYRVCLGSSYRDTLPPDGSYSNAEFRVVGNP
jgi:formylglycine-generating enzyme required for sulfatase activity